METDDNFNRIMEMHTEAERRRIAAQAMCAILSNPISIERIFSIVHSVKDIAICAVGYADALIAELDKKKES